jgi:MFS family permease
VAKNARAVSADRRVEEGVAAVSGQGLALATLCTLLFLTFLDNTVVSVALGDVQASLHAGVTDLQWVVGAYALTFASLMLGCGMIGDELGRKKVMLSGAGVFCAGSVLCALAPNVQTLIAGRAVMGLGAAASEPGTLSMLRHLYPDARARSRAIGVWAATSGLALAAGPVVGGILTGLWSWRGIFWFNLAFGLAAPMPLLVSCELSFRQQAGRGHDGGMHPWTGLADGVRLGVLTEWVTAELVDELLAECGRRDERPGALPARFMVYYVLALALFQQDSYDDVAENLVGALEGMDEAIPNRSSFTRARQRLGAGGDRGGVPPAGRAGGPGWPGRRVLAGDAGGRGGRVPARRAGHAG